MDITTILEAVVLACTLSADAFAASLAYGSSKIEIRFPTALIISLVSSGFLGISLLLGGFFRSFLPRDFSRILCFALLFLIGMTKILDDVAKTMIRRHSSLSKNIRFSFFHLRFILSVYADPENADVDRSCTISPMEAFALAIALSLDGMAAGFGAALGDMHMAAAVAASFVANVAAVTLGVHIGRQVSSKMRFRIAWLPGAVLIGLAFLKL